MSRRGGLADLETLLAIQKESATAGYANVFPQDRHPFPTDDVRETLRRQLEEQDTVAILDDQERGFALVGAGWLHRLYVRPSAWGEGVGSSLHDAAVAALREAGSAVASLWVLAENARARGFYERRRWRPNGAERAVPSPPYPIEVGYSLDLSGDRRL